MKKLQVARDWAGVPFYITSGFRCVIHNRRVGGMENSSHRKGVAADIWIDRPRRRWLILEALMEAGFDRIGIGRDFIHVDRDIEKVKNVIWLYSR